MFEMGGGGVGLGVRWSDEVRRCLPQLASMFTHSFHKVLQSRKCASNIGYNQKKKKKRPATTYITYTRLMGKIQISRAFKREKIDY